MDHPMIVIVGETASGKSSLAIDLAEKFNGQIVNADSWAVYKNFNIGTSKPTKEEQRQIKHYLFDVADPLIGFSAAEFKKLAIKAIAQINKEGRLPILVGGSGLYIDSIIYDYSFMPASEKISRQYYESLSLLELLKICEQLTYDMTDIDVNNKRRVIRLIENNGEKPTSKLQIPNTLILGIKVNTIKHHEIIHQRTLEMLKNGLENEVLNLSREYGWDIEAMKGIGYREFAKYFSKEINLNELIEKIDRDTLKLTKKQRTWFKRNKSIHWLSNREEYVELVTTFLNKYSI
jgi:tRNA dimethylallyltransferase